MRGKAKDIKHFQPLTVNEEENTMINALDELAAYEQFKLDIPKELRQALIDKLPAEEIYKKFANFAAVRIMQIVATEKDSGKALAAAKDILDRTHGKAVERKQIQHQLADMKDEEIDALLLSELSDVTDSDSEEEP